METLKKFFPVKPVAGDSKSLVNAIVIYVVGMIAASLVGWIVNLVLGWIPVLGTIIGIIVGIVCGLAGLYFLVGLIFAILIYCKII